MAKEKSPVIGPKPVDEMKGTEARADEPEVVWEEPKKTWVDVLTKSKVEALMRDLQRTLRIGNILEDPRITGAALSNIFQECGTTEFICVLIVVEKMRILVPAIEIFTDEVHPTLHISDYSKLRKRKVIFIVDENGYNKITEEDEDFDRTEKYIIYTGVDCIKPAFYFITVKREGE